MEKKPIRALIKAHFKMYQFAKMLGVKRLTLYRWINQESQWPLAKAFLAAELLGADPAEIQYVDPASGTKPA